MITQTLTLALIALLIHAANGAADCNKPPNLINVKSCCKIPEPNWSSFKEKCNGPTLPNSRTPNPCFLECLFNESRALDGDDLNMENLSSMLSTLFNGNQEFVNAYNLGFEKCQPIVKQRIADFKAKNKNPMSKGPGCTLKGTFYAMCAHKMVFIGCPAAAWTASSECEAAKEYASTCEPKLGGPGGRRGESGKKRGRRDVGDTATTMDPSQVGVAADDPTQQYPQQYPAQRGPGQRRGGGQRWGGGGQRRQGQGYGQRQGMGEQQQGVGQQQAQPLPMGPPQRRGQGMRQGMGPNAQGQPMPMGRPGMGQGQGRNGQAQQMPMGQPGMGQGMRQGRGGQQRGGRRRIGQQEQSQDPNNVENIGQTQETTSQRRKRDLSEQEVLDFLTNWAIL